ncbi:hypothetical protein Tco_0180839 [Tanacetum coccineum]
MAFLDLEKAYDSVPRELIWRTLIDKGTPRRYVRVIRDMFRRWAKDPNKLAAGIVRYEAVHGEEGIIRIGDKILQPKESFRYLGSVIHRSGLMMMTLNPRIRTGWQEMHERQNQELVLADHESLSKQGGSGRIENAEVDVWV